MEWIQRIHPSENLKKTSRKVLQKNLGRFWLALLKSYFRMEVIGIENIPRKGPALIISNHSGFVGADAVLLTYVIKRATRRRARLLAHRAFFDFSSRLKKVSESFGLKKAGVFSGVEILKREQLLILFPEGEAGNFKATTHAYELQPFHTGFIRMALEAGAPIVPSFVIGAEESHLNLGCLDFSRFVRGIKIPLPVNLFPLPAKWKIVVLPPVHLRAICKKQYRDLPEKEFQETLLGDFKELRRLTRHFQRQLQKQIWIELRNRPFIYLKLSH